MDNSNKICQRCGALFQCTPSEIHSCQCKMQLSELTLVYLKKTKYDCLCVHCLKALDEMIGAVIPSSSIHDIELSEGSHYYIDKGKWVFTEYYHILRGYCCQSGCRHCAYGFKRTTL